MKSNLGNILHSLGNNGFIGQIPPEWNQHNRNSTWEDAHGDRVKVRISGMHPMSGDDSTLLKDEDLPWAIVEKPTTYGNRNHQSTGLWGGEWVRGYFLDEDKQIPVITAVLGNNITEYEIKESINGTTQGKRVDRFNGGLKTGPHQTKGVTSSTTGPAQPTKQDFDNAKESTPPERQIVDVYTDEYGDTYEVTGKNVGTELNDDGTPVSFNIVKKLN